jgi:hypothetical protein
LTSKALQRFLAAPPRRVVDFRDVLRLPELFRAPDVLFRDVLFRDVLFREVPSRDAVLLRAPVFRFAPPELLLDFRLAPPLFVWPASLRCLFTVRAAISFARAVPPPRFWTDSLMCSY